jgi:hypothetical protein
MRDVVLIVVLSASIVLPALVLADAVKRRAVTSRLALVPIVVTIARFWRAVLNSG